MNMNIANTAPTKPTHRVYAVTRKPGSEKAYWAPIGAAWAHRDEKGFAIRLELPGRQVAHVGIAAEERHVSRAPRRG